MASLGDLLVRVGANIDGFEKAMGTVSQRLNAIDREANKAFSGFDKLGDRLKGIGVGLTAAITAPLAGIGVAAFKAGEQFDDALDKIRVSTGATGAALQGLSGSFSNVFKTVPVSANEAATAIGTLNTRLGLVGKPLEDMSTQMLNLSRITKSELEPLIAATTRAFGDWSIATEKQGASLDYLFKVSQSTNIGITRLTELVVQFGAPMRALGYSFEQTAALMGRFEKEGVNLETVMSGLRQALGNFAKAGLEPQKALQDVIAAIKNAKSESEATGIAFQVFGKRAAVDMSRAIIEGRFEIDKMVDSLKASSDTINKAAADTNGFAEKWTFLKNRVIAALEPIGTKLLTVFEGMAGYVQPAIDAVSSLINAFANLPHSLQVAIVAFTGIAAAIGPVTIGIGAMLSAFSSIGGAVTLAGAGMTVLGGMIANITTAVSGGLVGALSLGEKVLLGLGYAAGIAAAAFAGWHIGKWAYDNIPGIKALGDAIADLILKIPGVESAIQRLSGAASAQARGESDLSFAVEKLAKSLAAKGIVIERAGKTTEQYAAALQKAAKDAGLFSQNTVSATSMTQKVAGAASGAGSAIDKLGKKYTEAANKAKHFDKVLLDHLAKLRDLREKLQFATEAEQFFPLEVRPETNEDLVRLASSMDGIISQMDILGSTSKEAQGVLDNLFKQGTKDATALEDALKGLGVTSVQSLQDQAEAARKHLEVVQNTRDANGKLLASQVEQDQALKRVLETERALAVARSESYAGFDKQLEVVNKRLDEHGLHVKGIKDSWMDFSKEVSTIITNFTQDIAKTLFDGTKDWGQKFTKLWKDLASAVTAVFIQPITAALTKFITSTLTDLIGGKGFGGLKKSILEVGDALKSVFGGGASAAAGVAGAAGGTANATGSAAGSAGSAAGATAAVGTSLTSIVTAVSGVVDAVSGVISNFQFKAMNKSLDIIVSHTLGILNELQNLRRDEWDREDHLLFKLDDMWRAILDVKDVLGVHILQAIEAIGGISVAASEAGRQLGNTPVPLPLSADVDPNLRRYPGQSPPGYDERHFSYSDLFNLDGNVADIATNTADLFDATRETTSAVVQSSRSFDFGVSILASEIGNGLDTVTDAVNGVSKAFSSEVKEGFVGGGQFDYNALRLPAIPNFVPQPISSRGLSPLGRDVGRPTGSTYNINIGYVRNRSDADYLVGELEAMGIRT